MTRTTIIVALVLSGLCSWQGYRWGYDASETKHQSELLGRIEAGQMLEQARRTIALERDDLARQLEEEAYADPVVVQRGLSPVRVRRLNALRRKR
ncbi:MAG: hypothetical protein JKX76_00575 [Colwellia sp.]|nr:hypothetical protein [Colwellia sp.]